MRHGGRTTFARPGALLRGCLTMITRDRPDPFVPMLPRALNARGPVAP